jgi:hypothetical protein
MSYTNPPNVTNNPPNVIGMAGSKKGETETANALIYLACFVLCRIYVTSEYGILNTNISFDLGLLRPFFLSLK